MKKLSTEQEHIIATAYCVMQDIEAECKKQKCSCTSLIDNRGELFIYLDNGGNSFINIETCTIEKLMAFRDKKMEEIADFVRNDRERKIAELKRRLAELEEEE